MNEFKLLVKQQHCLNLKLMEMIWRELNALKQVRIKSRQKISQKSLAKKFGKVMGRPFALLKQLSQSFKMHAWRSSFLKEVERFGVAVHFQVHEPYFFRDGASKF